MARYPSNDQQLAYFEKRIHDISMTKEKTEIDNNCDWRCFADIQR